MSKKESVLPHKPDLALLESFRYINSMPGKNVRGLMIDCFQSWLTVDQSSKPQLLDSVKEIIGDLHNASLMVDDIEDNVSNNQIFSSREFWHVQYAKSVVHLTRLSLKFSKAPVGSKS